MKPAPVATTLDTIPPAAGQTRLVLKDEESWSTPLAGLMYEVLSVEDTGQRTLCMVRIEQLPLNVQEGWWTVGNEYGWPLHYAAIKNSIQVNE